MKIEDLKNEGDQCEGRTRMRVSKGGEHAQTADIFVWKCQYEVPNYFYGYTPSAFKNKQRFKILPKV